MKKVSNDDLSSRISTIDTNTIAKKSNETPESYTPLSTTDDQNFLVGSHKRTKQKSGRYFNDERISLPLIKSNSEINKEIPFSIKRISCSKNIKRCLEDGNSKNESEDSQKILSENYYKKVEQKSMPLNMQKGLVNNNGNYNSKHRTRNNINITQRNTDRFRQDIDVNNFENGVLSQDYVRFKQKSQDCE